LPNRAGRHAARQNRLVALSDPLRAEILRILVERTASPVEMAHELGASTQIVSHHTKRLVALDCAELVEERKVQGAIQHFYRATERALVATEEWEEMNQPEAQSFLAETMQMIIDDFLDSEKAQLVGHDAGFHLTRTPVVLDEQGREEGLEIFEQARLAMAEVERRSAERSEESGETSFRYSSALGLFRIPSVGKRRLTD
jgi:DNA-binding transcriptional ArsR family regulator